MSITRRTLILRYKHPNGKPMRRNGRLISSRLWIIDFDSETGYIAYGEMTGPWDTKHTVGTQEFVNKLISDQKSRGYTEGSE